MGDERTGSDDAPTVQLPDAAPAALAPRAEPDARWAGRYTLLRKLAEGGMGEVHVAYDEQLDRRVAIKLLRRQARSPGFEQRMQREAQALARLSHPNVVQVYDVGARDDRLFVTMELVVGADLRRWWQAAPRSWRAVVDVILQAGEGLAAAHRAGLVHRDIKPDNILVGDDGRVRVADFGLARADTTAPDDPTTPTEPHHGGLLDSPLTEQGALVGTPAYMAPEQFQRLPVDARTDLFALCVVLYEGLYGERPFRGKHWQEVAVATLAGRYTPPARAEPVPGWLTRAIARGLAVDPDERHPTVDVLLAELRRPQQQARRRRQWTLALGGLGLGVAVGATALQGPAPCAGVDASAAALWTPERQAAVHAALTAASPAAASEISPRLAERIGRRVQDLEDMSRETCLAHQQGDLSANLYDRARACLDRRRDEVEALLGVLAAPDVEVVARSLTAADALTDLAACSDRAALLAQVAPPDPAVAAAIPPLARRLDQARALRLAGRARDADALLGPLVADAVALAYTPLTAEARTERGLVALDLFDMKRAADDLASAVALAESVGADELRLTALTGWLRAVGTPDGSPALLAALEPQALALAERRGEAGRKPHALVLLAAGEAWLETDNERASADLTAAIDRLTALGDAAPQLAEALNDLALLRTMQRRYPEAHALYQRARELLAASLGPHHPNLGFLANNEGRLYDKQGDHAAARAWFAAAHDLWAPAYGPDNPNTLIAALHLARMAVALGDDAAAATHAGHVLAARARALGDADVSLAQPLQILAGVDLRRGDLASARARTERALAILAAAHGEASPKLLDPLATLARVALADARPDDALALAARALPLAQTDARKARIHLDLAEIHWARRDAPAAHAAVAAAAAALPAEAAAWLAAHPS